MLTREQRDKWAEELESGKWKQGHNLLCHNGRYCCLGVLAKAILTPGRPDSHQSYPKALSDDTQAEFVHMNDDDRLTFIEIAKHVRELPVSDPADLAEYVIQNKGAVII